MENENKNKMGMIVIIIILVVMFAVFTGGFIYTITLLNSTKAANGDNVKKEVAEYKLEDVKNVDIAESITVNLLPSANDTKKHMAIIKLQVCLNSKDKDYKKLKLETLIPTNEIAMRDIVIGILRNKTYEELEKPDSTAILKQEILGSFQEFFGTNAIVDVLVAEFNYQ